MGRIFGWLIVLVWALAGCGARSDPGAERIDAAIDVRDASSNDGHRDALDPDARDRADDRRMPAEAGASDRSVDGDALSDTLEPRDVVDDRSIADVPGDSVARDADVFVDGPDVTDVFGDRIDAMDAFVDRTSRDADDGCSAIGCGLVAISVSPASQSLVEGAIARLTATGLYFDRTTVDLTHEVKWSSSDASAASVGNDFNVQGLVASLGTGETTITAVFGSLVGTARIVVTPAPPVALEIPFPPSRLPKGASLALTAIQTLENAVPKDVSGSVVWSSTQPSVASVDANGVLTAHAAGPTRISATMGGFTDSFHLRVTSGKVIEVTVRISLEGLPPGATGQMTASGVFDDQEWYDITSFASWSTSNPSRAVVGNTRDTKGRIDMVASGPVTISAALDGVTGSLPVEVSTATLQKLEVQTLGDWMIIVGQFRSVDAIGTYSDGSTRYLTNSVAWSIEDPNIATRDGATLRGREPGRTNIVAKYGGMVGSWPLDVRVDEIVRLDLELSSSTLPIGELGVIGATAFFFSGQGSYGRDVAWTAEDPSLLFITNTPFYTGQFKGRITGLLPGSTSILAHYQGRTASVPITIVPPIVDAGSQ